MNEIIKIGFIAKTGIGSDGKAHQSNLVYSNKGISPCVCAGFCIKQQPTMVIVRSKK